MPGIPGYNPADPTANLIRKSGLSILLVNPDGTTVTARYSNLGAADLAVGENSRLAAAIGDATNIGVYGWSEDRENYRLPVDATVYDETYADSAHVLYMTFQNNEGRTMTVDVPAPKATLFGPDGVTLLDLPADPVNDTPETTIIRELIAASENVINTSFAPVNSYQFVRGTLRPRKKPMPRGAGAKPTPVEPGTNTGTA